MTRTPVRSRPPRRRTHVAAPLVAAAIAAVGLAGPAAAQCIEYDFEDLAVGTVVTTQYPGVTFDAIPDSCGGSTAIRIGTPSNGTSSGTRALIIDTGCPDFSPDFIRMVFDDAQRAVSFTCGLPQGTLQVRAYASASGGTPIQIVTVGSSFGSVRSLVRLGDPDAATPNIRRVEIESLISDFEGIDDLSFGADPTPPIARIDSPAWGTCICGPVAIVGEACDPDGSYGFDTLEVRSVGAAPEDPWIEVGLFTTPFCGGGTLYTFNPASLGLGGGTYVLRLTVENGCGTASTAITTVRYDQSAPGIGLDRPVAGAEVCGIVDLCGAITDNCSVDWSVSARRPGGPEFLVGEGGSGECGIITAWDTTGVGLGAWELVIRATDDCGFTSTLVRPVTVVADCGQGPDVNGDGTVDFADLLAVLAAWDLP
jgi:hypothetical protein